jgi:hypothetical protein
LLLDIVIPPIHPTPPPCATHERAGHYYWQLFSDGRWIGRTGTIFKHN